MIFDELDMGYWIEVTVKWLFWYEHHEASHVEEVDHE